MPEQNRPRMSQTALGKAFEYACLTSIADYLLNHSKTYTIKEDKAYITARECYNILDDRTKDNYIAAAKTALKIILPLEPRIADIDTEDKIELYINTDSKAKGEDGDVRDVVCLRSSMDWEVGFSCKHNHEALKHPRLTQEKLRKGEEPAVADFGTAWIGYPCSNEYFHEMSKVIDVVKSHIGENWEDAFASDTEKHNQVYVPALECIMNEIRRLCEEHEDAPAKLLSYFFGSNDFYKIISLERARLTKVVAFNMSGTLNTPSNIRRAITRIPRLSMPSRLIEIRFKEKNTGEISKTTITLVFDHGWTVNMRLHSGDKKVKATGLKFDITLEGNPHGIYQQQRSWLEE